MTKIEDELGTFFDRYIAAWNAEDAVALSEFFAIPYLIATKSRTTFFETEIESIANLEALIHAYRAQGAAARVLEQLEYDPLPDNAVLARLRWRLLDEHGMTVALLPTSYTLASENGVWRIVAVDAKGETDAWFRGRRKPGGNPAPRTEQA